MLSTAVAMVEFVDTELQLLNPGKFRIPNSTDKMKQPYDRQHNMLLKLFYEGIHVGQVNR